MVFKHPDFLHEEPKVIPVRLGLGQDVIKGLQGRLSGPAHLKDGVPPARVRGTPVLNARLSGTHTKFHSRANCSP